MSLGWDIPATWNVWTGRRINRQMNRQTDTLTGYLNVWTWTLRPCKGSQLVYSYDWSKTCFFFFLSYKFKSSPSICCCASENRIANICNIQQQVLITKPFASHWVWWQYHLFPYHCFSVSCTWPIPNTITLDLSCRVKYIPIVAIHHIPDNKLLLPFLKGFFCNQVDRFAYGSNR